MTRIIFDLDVLNERGTTVATFDYASHGKRLSGIEPIFFYGSMESERAEEALARISQAFETVKYNSPAHKVRLVKETRADIHYSLVHARETKERIPGVLNAGHAVFDYTEPFGDVWAYISLWLSRHASGGRYPSVPHIVNMPQPDGHFRERLNIPADAVVVGRYGGYNQFDLTFVHRAVLDVVETRPDIYFLFANTQPFATHPRIIYLPAMYAPEKKARFIATCDWMLHARYRGETFGLSMAEFLALDCPVMCWNGGWERNHLQMQPNNDFVYSSYRSLYRLLMSIIHENRPINVSRAVQAFSPENVWQKWEDTFLNAACRTPVMPLPRSFLYQRKTKNRFRKALCFLQTGGAPYARN